MTYIPGGGGGSGSVGTSSDVALNNPSDNEVLTYNASTAKWINKAVPVSSGGSGGTPGMVFFDDFFTGADDNAKFAAMNTWAQGQGAGGGRPSIVFATRTYNFSTSIQLWSGLSLIGGRRSSVREYTTGTVFNWQGASGSSMFVFTGTQTEQGYPSDGSPRDINVHSILFDGTSTTHWIQKSTHGTSYSGKVLWMSTIRDCGWKNWNTIHWGWMDGVTIDGQVHIQGCYDTPFFLGGAENNVFGDGFSFMDSAAAYPIVADGKPFIRSLLDKSRIGRIMVTSRRKGHQISIEGGHNLVVDGMALDAQTSDPVWGSGMRISGGNGIVITNCSFKGMMSDPANATGGAAANKGWIHITGGKQITITGNNFARFNSVPGVSVPVVYVGSGVGDGQVKWGFNGYSYWDQAEQVVLQQAAANKIVRIADPKVNIVTAA